MQYLLIGNPNAGKTTLFNALTHSARKTGNWHGVTVEAYSKTVQWGGERVTVTDVPGLYSLSCTSPEEAEAKRCLSSDAALVNVIEAATLPRALRLTRELAAAGYSVRIVLTMTDELSARGGSVDEGALSALLSVPVCSFSDTRRGRRALLRFLTSAPAARARVPDSLPPTIFRLGERRENRLERLCYHPLASLCLFFALIALTFFVTFSPHALGGMLKALCERGFDGLAAWARRGMAGAPPALVAFVSDGVLHSLGSVLSFLPQILLLYFFLILLEESGYLSILAFVTDDLFAKIGLTGRAIFSLLMGFGCTATAIQTTKSCSPCLRRKVILCLPYLSCSAKLPVYLTVVSALFANPFLPILCLYLAGVGIAILVSLLLRPCADSMLAEVAPLRIPRAKTVFKSLSSAAKNAIIKTSTVILAFLLLTWFLSSFDGTMRYCPEAPMLAQIGSALRFVFYPIGIRDWQAAYAALSGLIAKENVAGLLRMFYPDGLPFSAPSAIAFAAFLLTCSPCVSAIGSAAECFGKRKAVLLAAVQTLSALGFSYLVYAVCVHPALLILFPLAGIALEILHRHRKAKSQIVHR